MKLKLLLLTILLSGFHAFSQTKFESGYIILNNGTKTNCLIKNEDWAGSPTTFDYKSDENSDVKIGSIDNIKEFGSGESFKYVRGTLNIDQSTDVVNNLTDERNPIMKEETLFLKTLVEGKASLYYTEKENTKRYLYKIDDADIEQLIYKRYLVTPTKMGANEYYKQQLATTLTCSNLGSFSFENLQYKRADLINAITKYNDCENIETVVYNKNIQRSKFNLSIRPGVTFSSFSMVRFGEEKLDFEPKTSFRIGLEAEYVLPFNNNKWAVFIEPTYHSYKAEKELLYIDLLTIQEYTLVTVNYNSIELPMGGRHYMFINQKAAIFIDAAVIMDIAMLDSNIDSSNEASYDLKVEANAAIAFGVGLRFKNKYSIEARYHTARQLLNYTYIDSAYKSFGIIAGYNFL